MRPIDTGPIVITLAHLPVSGRIVRACNVAATALREVVNRDAHPESRELSTHTNFVHHVYYYTIALDAFLWFKVYFFA